MAEQFGIIYCDHCGDEIDEKSDFECTQCGDQVCGACFSGWPQAICLQCKDFNEGEDL